MVELAPPAATATAKPPRRAVPLSVSLGFVGISLVLIASFGAVFRNAMLLIKTQAWVTRTHETIQELNGALNALVDAETGQRGFVLSGRPEFLEPFYAGIQKAPARLSRIAELVADKPTQASQLQKLNDLASQKIGFMERTITLRRTHGMKPAQELIASGQGKRVMDEFRAVIAAMLEEERRLLDAHTDKERASSEAVNVLFLSCLFVDAMAMLAAYVLLRRLFVRRDAMMGKLEANGASLRALTARLELILDSASEGIIGIDEEGKVAFLNQAAVDATGRKAQEWLGAPFADAIRSSPSVQDAQASPIAAILLDGRTRCALLGTMRRWDGSDFPIEFSVGALRQGDRVEGAVVVFRDVTVIRKLEVERMRLMESERQARLEAQFASTFKDDLLRNVSHEMRTPITAVLGWVDLGTQQGAKSAFAAPAFQAIKRNGEALLRMVEDLVAVSREVKGLAQGKPELIPVLPLLREEAERLASRGASVTVTTSSENELIWFDRRRFALAVSHVLDNAVKFSPQGSAVEISLSTSTDRVVIAVRDQGIGIPQDFLPHAFDLFRQGDTSMTRSFGGLGLGLYMARAFIEAQGGSIRIASGGEGKGTEVSIVLPRLTKGEASVPDPASSALGTHAPP